MPAGPVVYHAESQSIGVRFEVTSVQVRIEVADDGDGFRARPLPPDPARRHGWASTSSTSSPPAGAVIDGEGARVWFEIDR